MQNQTNNITRFLIYGFVYSTLFTGVIRKWVLPDFSNEFMAMPILFSALICVTMYTEVRLGILEKSFAIIGIIVFLITMVYGHQNLTVAIYGCLPYWFGLTTSVILGSKLRRYDIIKITRLLVITGLVNSIFIIIQFNAPILSEINTANYIASDQITDVEVARLAGGFRPSGLFMHNSQSTMLQSVTFPILLYNLFVKRYLPRWLCLTAIVLELFAIPFSISRTNFMYHLGISLFFAFTCLSKDTLIKIYKKSPYIIVATLLFLSTNYGKQAISTMKERFSNASETLYSGSTTSEGTLMDIYDRNVVYNIKAIIDPRTLNGDEVPFWGYGQGMSTQVGGKILGLTGNAGFSLAEWDGLRIMCESGFIFGWLIILIRLVFVFQYVFKIKDLRRDYRFLALSLLPAFILAFYLSTTWGNIIQASMSYMIAGLFIGSCKFSLINPSSTTV